ncbi:hypothetical protein [Flexithrix dorotheae]|uniref:hypothetical protein n=1 Tax=Flexithrix dorotheae TaxID=70993 RepID=UPI00036B4D00|nr:hypothetical protein [Flexithrix dorotheae]
MIRLLLSVTITFLCIIPALSQSRVPIEEYGKRDCPGGYIDLDGEFHEGLVYIYPLYNGKLNFRKEHNDYALKLKSEEILGFIIGKDEFHSLKEIPIINFLGFKKVLSCGFGKMVTLGKIEAFMVYVQESNYITGSIELNKNMVLFMGDKKIAIPINRRLKRNRLEKVKDELKQFFDQDPYWTEQIDQILTRESGFVGIYDLVEEYNQGA